jgi:YbgC/YbaW family acyl-CoA thioester hydrolase
VKLHQTDGAAIVFFGNYFALAHDAYEAFMENSGFGFRNVIEKADILFLIVHAEADYKQSLPIGEAIEIEMTATKVGKTSYTLLYKIKNAAGDIVSTVKTVHATIYRENKKSCALSEKLKAALEGIFSEESD